MSIELAEERGAYPDGSRAHRGSRPARSRSATPHEPASRPRARSASSPAPRAASSRCFSLAHYRTMGDGTVLPEVAENFQQVARERGFWSAELMEELAERRSIRGRPDIPEDVQRLFVTATTSAGSGTCACRPRSRSTPTSPCRRRSTSRTTATVEDIRAAYMLALRDRLQGHHRSTATARATCRCSRTRAKRSHEAAAGRQLPPSSAPRRRRLPDERPLDHPQVPRRRAGGLPHGRPLRRRHAGRDLRQHLEGGLDRRPA